MSSSVAPPDSHFDPGQSKRVAIRRLDDHFRKSSIEFNPARQLVSRIPAMTGIFEEYSAFPVRVSVWSGIVRNFNTHLTRWKTH
jgi:hypothetical protein